MRISQALIGDQRVIRSISYALFAAATFMTAACDYKQQEQSGVDHSIDSTRIGDSGLEDGPLVNESAVDLTAGDLAELNRQSKNGSAIASNVLAQEAERVKDYRKAAHFQS